MAVKWNKTSSGDQTPHPPEVVEVFYRRCKVCEWEGPVILKAGEDPDCPWCHAPTESSDAPVVLADAATVRKNPHAAALGRLGGLKGGRARAKALTAIQRKRIASRAARARWGKKDEKENDGKNGKN